jgi:dynein assembly factor 3
MKGTVFEVRDSMLTHPNKTLASVDGLLDPTEKVTVTKWGYFGDVSMGPFISWGIDSENKELLKTANDQPTHSSNEISQNNVTMCLMELHTGRPDKSSYKSESIEVPKFVELEETSEDAESNDAASQLDDANGHVAEAQSDALFDEFLNSFKIYLLPCDPSRALSGKYQFDVAVVGTCLAHRTPQVVSCLQTNGTLLCETVRWFPELKMEQKGLFCEKIIEMGTHEGKLQLNGLQRRKLKQVDNQFPKIANKWDYLIFQPRLSEGITGNLSEVAHGINELAE